MFTLPPYLLKDERVRFSVGSLEILSDVFILSAFSIPGATRSQTGISTKEFTWG